MARVQQEAAESGDEGEEEELDETGYSVGVRSNVGDHRPRRWGVLGGPEVLVQLGQSVEAARARLWRGGKESKLPPRDEVACVEALQNLIEDQRRGREKGALERPVEREIAELAETLTAVGIAAGQDPAVALVGRSNNDVRF